MSPQQWQRVKEVAGAALELEAERRSQFLDRQCGSDGELRRAVEKLLEGDRKAGTTIEAAVAEAAGEIAKAPAREDKERLLGQTISHYTIIEKLGEGGMGVVYKAEDTQLRRTVALKFLVQQGLNEPETKARMIREAQAAASLDHPHICSVHGIHEEEGRTFIAMAYIDGESLVDKIKQRPLALEEALRIAIQMGEGLQEAHEHGVVHRDIKPANIMLTRKGKVKVMDFGLAQLVGRTKLTKSGTTMGTPVYMSPEQALGQRVDRRSDIWSLGVVLYEMLAGKPPFDDQYEQAIIYSITNQQPEPLTARRTGLPVEIDRMIGKALAKSPDERYQHVEEITVDLRTLQKKLESGQATVLRPTDAGPSQARIEKPIAPRPASEEVSLRRKLRLQQALFAVTAIALLAVSFLYFREIASEAPEALLRKFTVMPPAGFNVTVATGLAISPNGKHIAIARGGEKLWIQDLGQHQDGRPIEGEEVVFRPFWSPGSDFVGFATGGDELKKVSVQGGPAIRVCQIPISNYFWGSWSPDGNSIVFAAGSPVLLYEVPASGGTPKPLNLPDQPVSPTESPTRAARWPHFLPSEVGDRVLVFTSVSADDTIMVVHDLETGRREVLGPGTLPFYSPSGHLLYQPSFVTNQIWALPFSLDTLKATGEPFPIAQHARLPTVSADQTLVYGYTPLPQRQLVWLDRRGNKIEEIGLVGEDIRDPELSPDGRRLVYRTETDGGNWDLWVWDLTRGVKHRLSTDPKADLSPVWSPDGQQVAFSSERGGSYDVFLKPADGGGEVKALLDTSRLETPLDWSRHGRYLLCEVEDPETAEDLWYLERNEEDSGWELHPFVQEPFNQWGARFSPNGRYVAYISDESGQHEVYVRSFPEGGRKITVSNSGGRKPRWRRDGKELFYLEGDTLMAVPVSTDPSFSAGTPTQLFEHPSLQARWDYQYDVSADGQRFIIAEEVGEAPKPSIRVVQNWFAEFRDRQGGAQ